MLQFCDLLKHSFQNQISRMEDILLNPVATLAQCKEAAATRYVLVSVRDGLDAIAEDCISNATTVVGPQLLASAVLDKINPAADDYKASLFAANFDNELDRADLLGKYAACADIRLNMAARLDAFMRGGRAPTDYGLDNTLSANVCANVADCTQDCDSGTTDSGASTDSTSAPVGNDVSSSSVPAPTDSSTTSTDSSTAPSDSAETTVAAPAQGATV